VLDIEKYPIRSNKTPKQNEFIEREKNQYLFNLRGGQEYKSNRKTKKNTRIEQTKGKNRESNKIPKSGKIIRSKIFFPV
jgi:hypothetical protein